MLLVFGISHHFSQNTNCTKVICFGTNPYEPRGILICFCFTILLVLYHATCFTTQYRFAMASKRQRNQKEVIVLEMSLQKDESPRPKVENNVVMTPFPSYANTMYQIVKEICYKWGKI